MGSHEWGSDLHVFNPNGWVISYCHLCLNMHDLIFDILGLLDLVNVVLNFGLACCLVFDIDLGLFTCL